MAGDWIKLETTTPDKPEVYTLAERLALSRDEVLGKLVRMFVWFDQHLASGNAPVVTEKSLNAHIGVTDFAQALVDVGWLAVDNAQPGAVVIRNFERHNGKTAKRRALTKQRAGEFRERQRNDGVTPEPVQEKRREERKERRSRATTIPEGFKVSEEVRTWAAANGYSTTLDAHFAYFVDFATANKKTYTDWNAALRNCVRGDWGGIRKAATGFKPAGAPSPYGTDGKIKCRGCGALVSSHTGYMCRTCYDQGKR